MPYHTQILAPVSMFQMAREVASPDYSWMPSRGVRNGSPPRLLTRKADAGVLAVRRGGRTRKASPGERIGRRSRYSWIVRA